MADLQKEGIDGIEYSCGIHVGEYASQSSPSTVNTLINPPDCPLSSALLVVVAVGNDGRYAEL